MKKFYLFMAALLGLFSTAAMAQDELEIWGADEEMPLIYETGQLSSPWSDPSEGTNIDALWDNNNGTFWHTSWHSEPPHSIMGSHFIQIQMPDGYYDLNYYYNGQVPKTVENGVKKIVFKVVRRNTDNNHPIRWAVYGTNEPLDFEYDEDAKKAIWDDPMGDRDNCTLLAEITTELKSLGQANADGETHISEPFDPQGFEYLRFYVDETQSVKSGGEGNAVFWHAAEMQLYPYIQLDPVEVKMKELEETFMKYEYEPDYYQYKVGTRPGQYSEEAVNNFITAIDDAYELLESLEEITVAQLQEAIDNLNNTYQAVLDSKVPFVLPTDFQDGYYRIRSAMVYTNNFRDGDEDDEGEPTRQAVEVYKYLSSAIKDGQRVARWGTPGGDVLIDSLDICLEENVPSLWKITNKVFTDTLGNKINALDIVNCANGARFAECQRSTKLVMSKLPTDTLVAIDLVTDYEEQPIFNLRAVTQIADEPTNFYSYFHMEGHSGGSGTEGNIVGWNRTYDRNKELLEENPFGASEWIFEPVDAAIAENLIANYDNSYEIMVDSFKMMRNDANSMLPIARDIQKEVDTDKPFVSEENPIFSPCSDSAEGQNIEYLWDTDASHFWHTDWHGAFTAEDHHFIQVEIPEGSELTTAVFWIKRRNTTSGNQINKWTVWGTNHDCKDDYDETDGSLLVDEPMVQGSEGLEKLADVTTPYVGGKNDAEVYSDVFDTKGYKFLRFYCAGTCNNDGSQGSNEKFFHLSKFQLYPGRTVESPTSQYNVMGDIAKNLENILEEQKDINPDAVVLTQAQFDALKEAYMPFKAIFTNPAALRAKIEEVKDAAKIVVVGTAPGFWPDNSKADALNNAVTDAKAYDVAGAYTPDQSKKFIADLDTLAKQIEPAALPIKVGKWYRFRFGDKEFYEKYELPFDGSDNDYRVVDEDTVGVIDYCLFNKYVTVAKSVNVEIDYNNETGDPIYGKRVRPLPKDSVTLENYMYADSLENIVDKDMALFRFVQFGDSACAIQNKATGLYLQRLPESGYMRLGIQPSFFTQGIAGYGQNFFMIKNFDNAATSPMHLARNYNSLQSWGNNASGWGNTDGRRGSFFVEEVEDVAPDYNPARIGKISMWPGSMTARCYPVSITCDPEKAQLWTVDAITREVEIEGEPETVTITLAKMQDNTAIAGRPFILVAAGDYIDPEERLEEDEPVLVELTYGNDYVAEPLKARGLVGVFAQKTIGAGWLKPNGPEFELTATNDATVSTNRAYVADKTAFERKAEILAPEYDVDKEDAVKSVLDKLAKNGNIYTSDGRLVKRGNISSFNKMKRGMYIFDDIKVIIK